MDIKDSYLHGTVGVVKSISVSADKLKYKLADIAGTVKEVTLPVATLTANGLLSKEDKKKLDNMIATKVANDLILKIDSGTTEGTSLYTYNGSAAKTLDIKSGTGIAFSKTAGALQIFNSGVRSIATGTTNGTISVNTNGTSANVAVKGLGSAAYTTSGSYVQLGYIGAITDIANLYSKLKSYFGDNHVSITKLKDERGMWGHLLSKFQNPDLGLYGVDGCGLFLMGGSVERWSIDGKNTTDNPLVYNKYKIYDEGNLGIVSSSANGLAPKVINTNTATIGSAYYVLASTNGSATPSWYKLPTNAFFNTTYTFANGTSGNFTVTPSGGTAQTVSIGKPATAGTADATVKLKTKRKLWGLNFDGSADVSGNMTGVGSIKMSGDITIVASNNDRFLNFLYTSAGTSDSWRIGYLGSGSNETNYLAFQSTEVDLSDTWKNALLFECGTLKATFGGIVNAPTFKGNLDGTYVNKLTGYAKATAAANLATTDTLNTALGKLEYKADTAYDWYKSVTGTDNDNIINKWEEIVDFINSVKEGTDITDEFVTRKTAQIITGKKTFTSDLILSVEAANTDSPKLIFERNGSNNSYYDWLLYVTAGHLIFTSNNSGTHAERIRFVDSGGILINSKEVLHAGNYTSYLPFLNSSSTHATKASIIYAPSTAGTKGLVLTSNGSGAPVWSNSVGTANNGIFYIEGTGTTAGTWLGSHTGIASYYKGLTIAYKIPIAGASTTTLNINSLGAVTCYISTAKLTTHYGVGSVVILVYDGTYFRTADYDYSTTKVRQYVTDSGDTEYPLIFRYSISTTTTYLTDYLRYASVITVNPSTSTITASKFKGKLIGQVVGTNDCSTKNNALLVNGSGRSDLSPEGDTWIFGDLAASADWGIKHELGSDYISFYGSNTRTSYIDLRYGYMSANKFIGTLQGNATNGVFYIEGTGTTAGTWLGSHTGITSYYVGLTIAYKIPIAGASTTTLNINSLGAKTCYINTSKLTTHYGVGTTAILVYDGTYFRAADYWDGNNYAKVRQYMYDSSNAEYPLLFRYATTATTTYVTDYTAYDSGITINPSTNNLKGIKDLYLTGDISIKFGDSDKFVIFDYDWDKSAGASWRMGVLGSGSSDTNYFVVLSGTSTTSATAWNNVMRIGQNTYDIAISGNLYPLVNNTKTLGTSSLKWANVYATTFTGNLSGNATTATTANVLKATTIVSAKAFSLSNASWTDTSYTFASLTTGTYTVQVTSGSNLVASGIMSVYKNLSDTAGDEIPLHVYGTAGWRPYLRTYNNKLLISSNDASATSRTVTIKIALIL